MDQTQFKLRVMVDANILIAGSVWPRWPYEVLQYALRGDFQLVLSEYILQQARTHIRRRFPNHEVQFDRFLQACEYELVADPTREQVAQNLDLVRDPSDVPVALAAIHAGVNYLVSEDKDLTVQDETTAKLRQELNVLISCTFLREVMGWSSEALEKVRRRTWRDIPVEDEK
jgi:putative PIN family toxin of toxin-antitoxin system